MTTKLQANASYHMGTAWHVVFAWLVLAASLAPATGSAQTANTIDLEDVYRIELLVFADNEALARQASANNADLEQEHWAPPRDLAYPQQLVFLRRGSPASSDTASTADPESARPDA
ncbi:MAG: hypothetical protein HKO71_06375, partial [Pseudomonadales bacterium]|nr:hypothetical protein [Pseudomonadales bacterium]